MPSQPQRLQIRDLGYHPGLLPPGPLNSILDVPGVHISQLTVPCTSCTTHPTSTAKKGLTILSPRPLSAFHEPCAAGTFTFNGNGELTGSRQIADWGFTNTPIAFTNSLSLGSVFDGMWDWILSQQEAFGWDELTVARNYGTPVVGETADWQINSDLRANRLSHEDIATCFQNLRSAAEGAVVQEGQHGGGAGMTCQQFTGGTGTSSRLLARGSSNQGDPNAENYTLGVLVQSNYGHLQDLKMGGVPVGAILKKKQLASSSSSNLAGRTKDGSILILLLTDAPLSPHNLQRLARHATTGLAAVGGHGIGRTHSGDIFLAVSTAPYGPQILSEGTKMRHLNPAQTAGVEILKNESMDSLFFAAGECVEEAILNSMVGAREGTVGIDGGEVEGLPVEKVKGLLERYLVRV